MLPNCFIPDVYYDFPSRSYTCQPSFFPNGRILLAMSHRFFKLLRSHIGDVWIGNEPLSGFRSRSCEELITVNSFHCSTTRWDTVLVPNRCLCLELWLVEQQPLKISSPTNRVLNFILSSLAWSLWATPVAHPCIKIMKHTKYICFFDTNQFF